MEGLIFLRKFHGVKRLLIQGPGWTYKDIRHLTELLNQEGIEDMEMIIEPNGYDTQGQINLDAMELQMQKLQLEGKPYAVIGASGPTNPPGTVVSLENKKSLYQMALKYNAKAFGDDAAYIECVKPGERHTFAQVHYDEVEKIPVVINFATLSKGVTSMPSGRLGYISSNDQRLREFLVNRRDNTGLNTLSIFLANAIIRDPNVVEQLEAFLQYDIQERRKPVEKLLQERKINIIPSQHYYQCAEVFEDGDDPWLLIELLAQYKRAGAIAAVMLSNVERNSDELKTYPWRNYVRFALGGEISDYDQPAREVAYWLNSLSEVKMILKQANGNVDLVKKWLSNENEPYRIK